METTLVTRREQLEQVLALQCENLRDHVPPEVARREGFVTVSYTLDTLERMHALAPSVVALDGERLAGYALVLPMEARAFVPTLEPMFEHFATLRWRGQPLTALPYYVMGQVCVAHAYRGQGVFDALYREHRVRYSDRWSLCVTEVATRNTRSMRAHARVGFEAVTTCRDAQDEWAVVAWDWRQP